MGWNKNQLTGNLSPTSLSSFLTFVAFNFCLWPKTLSLRGTGGKALATDHRVVCFDSWGWQSFVSTCDVFNCLFPLDVQNEIQLLSRVFSYSWLVCLLGFWLRNASLVKVRNPISDGIVFVFHLAWRVRGSKVKVSSDSGLTWIYSFQELHLEW